MAESQNSRRTFFKVATVAIGGVIGAVTAFPLLRYVLFPVRRRVVAEPGAPVDVLPEDALEPGAAPIRVEISTSDVRDAWSVSGEVPLGAAWVRKSDQGEITALSSSCPHLGCAIDFDGDDRVFKCPCHKSAFAIDGAKLSGPSKRGLDPLPVQVEDGRIKIKFVRYRPDVAKREPV